MKKIHMTAVLFAALLASTSAMAQIGTDRSLPTEEYADIPKGMLLDKDGKKPVDGADIAALAAGTAGEDAPKHMNFDTAQKLYRQGKFAEALSGLVPLATSGNTSALEILGVMTRMGQGVEKNSKQAAEYLLKAANDNKPLAQHHLGVMYYTGDGVDADSVQALSWLQLAILHYPAGAEKQRALQDRDAVYKQINRRDREAAMKIARDFLDRKGEGHLMDLQE